jgi:hypothetical protein
MEREMARVGRTLQDLAAEIERRAEVKKDIIAPVPKLSIEVVDDKPVIAVSNGGSHTYEPLDIAHGQLAEYVGVPMAYYRRMLADDPSLLAQNVNRWLRDKAQDKRMVRTLDGRARAFLSNGYRTLENEDLAEAVLPVLLEQALVIISCEITDRRLYIKAVDRNIERDVPTGRKMGDGSHVFFDTCSPAITISNSEVGLGSLSIETGVYTRACTNLAMIGTNFRKYHVGKRADLGQEVFELLTDDTKKATDKAVWMQTRDVVKAAFDEVRFAAITKKLEVASQDVVPAEQTVEVIERVGRRFSLTEGERKGVLAKLIEGADLTRYGLHAAVTRYSQELSVNYDRATELEKVGGEIIDLAPTDWKRVAEVVEA